MCGTANADLAGHLARVFKVSAVVRCVGGLTAVVGRAERLEVHTHLQGGWGEPALGSGFAALKQDCCVGDVLGRAVVADAPVCERLNAFQPQPAYFKIAVIGSQIGADLPPRIGKGNAIAAEVHGV